MQGAKARGVRAPKFVSDAMLGSLARKLRALGFDTSYYIHGDDDGIMGAALAEGRLLLTADKSLAQRAKSRGVVAFLLEGRTDGIRLSSLVKQAKASGLVMARGIPRCSVCDGPLVLMNKRQVLGKVPLGVVSRHRRFYKCRLCGRYYWRGSHWKKLRWLERILG